MVHHLSRRALIAAGVGLTAARRATAQETMPRFSYPMGIPGNPLGDGLLIRHGYAVENIPYYPGWWHTGENWHAIGGESAGLNVYAVADGEVQFVGGDYPGRVIIVAHAPDLYSMYGHLDYAVLVEEGQIVRRGQPIATILRWPDDPARSHLHFELRTFLVADAINGTAPQYGVTCGYECPPGPGYWPMTAPEHPSALGWRNPTHVINRRAWPDGIPVGTMAVVSQSAPSRVLLWSVPGDRPDAKLRGNLDLAAGDRYPLLEIVSGDEAATGTSAEAYRLWYRIGLPDGDAWVQAAVPDASYAGSDGRPAAVRLAFLPAVITG
ncbi:MAG: M23 family metallopeptidase [Thermomicrobiales bacterium]